MTELFLKTYIALFQIDRAVEHLSINNIKNTSESDNKLNYINSLNNFNMDDINKISNELTIINITEVIEHRTNYKLVQEI